MTRIRLARPADAPALADIYAPYVSDDVISFELEPPDAGEMQRRLASTLALCPWLVLEEDAEVLGYAYGGRHRDRWAYQWSVDVTVYLRRGRHRRGYGRRLYRALLPLLRTQGFCAAHAGITLPNPSSVGLHEACGFRPVGLYPAVGWKRGAWHDVGWWQLELAPRTGTPAPIVPWPDARHTPVVRTLARDLDLGLELS